MPFGQAWVICTSWIWEGRGSIYLIYMDRQWRYGDSQKKKEKKNPGLLEKKGELILVKNEQQMFPTKGDKMDVGKGTKSIFFFSVSH